MIDVMLPRWERERESVFQSLCARQLKMCFLKLSLSESSGAQASFAFISCRAEKYHESETVLHFRLLVGVFDKTNKIIFICFPF